ncbi:MAG: ABC transporter permease [Candidatus Tectomicrobia bacterium]|uniref:ABC transporter permease n=1 Tax=Tectimicrobiota bacterium TaxID=2528274 RepID=A0A932MQ78_UNCTE|nr:ABC transporter permease [Candidatus Tectomicrobia bacterium]
MDFLIEGFYEGLLRVLTGDPEVWRAAGVTLQVSLWATLLASSLGLPAGYLLAVARFRGRGLVVGLLQSLLGFPTVVIGLLVYGLLSRRGPLGGMDLLFSPSAIVAGLCVLALPIAAVYGMTSVAGVDAGARETALTLGASAGRAAWTVFREARFGLMAAVLGAFGRVASEVGIAMMLGGNIEGHTRTLTTAIALESMKGEFGFGIALGMVLMSIMIAVSFLSRLLQRP